MDPAINLQIDKMIKMLFGKKNKNKKNNIHKYIVKNRNY